jgi:shikimate kinase
MRPSKRIFLVGMMGCGKTVVGTLLARKIRWRFLDTDRMIEARQGRSVAAIFQENGEPFFRRQETAVLRSLETTGPCVVATGGGILLRKANRLWLRKNGIRIYLRAGPRKLWERLRKEGAKSRPLLRGDHPQKVLAGLMAQREKLYRQADLTVQAGSPPRVVRDRILAALNRRDQKFFEFGNG